MNPPNYKFIYQHPNISKSDHCASAPLEPGEITLSASSATTASSSFIFARILLIVNHDETAEEHAEQCDPRLKDEIS
jgi:hypothetical protein